MKRTIIVGAGITGLSTGVFAIKGGNDVTILEQGGKVGGLSTSWSRDGFHFEGGIHWLVGSSRQFRMLNDLWKEAGALQENNPVSYQDPVIVLMDGERSIRLFRDIRKLRKELVAHSPKDRGRIKLLCSDIYLFKLFQLLGYAGVKKTLAFIFLLIPFIIRTIRLFSISTENYADRFSDRDLSLLLKSVINPGHNALSLIYTLASYANGDSGYPEGGALRMAGNMEEKFIREGGKIIFGQKVSRICMDGGKVSGVISNGTFFPADDVIVTSDTRKALENLLDNPLKEKWAEKMLDRLVSQQCMFICLGVKASLKDFPDSMRIVTDRPLEAGGHAFECLAVNNYASYEGYAPEGCSSLTLILRADCYDYWKAAREDGTYTEKKEKVISDVVNVLSVKIPGIKDNVTVTDMATPLTYERYCDTYKGGWMSIWEAGTMPPMVPPECRTVKGLHFAGQRTMLSGGLPIAIQTGRNAALSIKQ